MRLWLEDESFAAGFQKAKILAGDFISNDIAKTAPSYHIEYHYNTFSIKLLHQKGEM